MDELVGEKRISSSLSFVVPCWRRCGLTAPERSCDTHRLRVDERAVVMVRMVGREGAPGAAVTNSSKNSDG